MEDTRLFSYKSIYFNAPVDNFWVRHPEDGVKFFWMTTSTWVCNLFVILYEYVLTNYLYMVITIIFFLILTYTLMTVALRAYVISKVTLRERKAVEML